MAQYEFVPIGSAGGRRVGFSMKIRPLLLVTTAYPIRIGGNQSPFLATKYSAQSCLVTQIVLVPIFVHEE